MIDLLIYALLGYFFLKPSKKTKKIAILGIKGAGKKLLCGMAYEMKVMWKQ